MLTVLIASLVVSIGVSFLCSLMEAGLYAVSVPYVRSQAESGTKVGRLLLSFKEDMAKPIAAILILNTVAHTAGASVAGWSAGEIFGSGALLPFSIVYTLAVLYLSEILPKLIGVAYSKTVARTAAPFLEVVIRLSSPLIWVSDKLTAWVTPGKKDAISAQEVLSMAEMGTEEGALDNLEGSVIANIIGLDKLLVKNVMTPRVVVIRAKESQTIADIRDQIPQWNFTRIPLFAPEDPDHLTGYVTQRDILFELVKGNSAKELKEIARPLKTIPEVMRCDRLLVSMLEEKEHLYAVVDEHGGLAGIITLEDIVEEIVGSEIIDEYDEVGDMRALARLQRIRRASQRRSKGAAD